MLLFILLLSVYTQTVLAQPCAVAAECITCTTECLVPDRHCHSLYIPRSAHANSTYFFLERTNDLCDPAAYVDLGLEYQQSFRAHDIASCLFGSQTLLFQGSQLPARTDAALIADNFGLSPFFDGALTFHPKIRNFNLHATLHGDIPWIEPLYLEVQATASAQWRSLGACETIITGTVSTNSPFPVGYMAGASSAVTPASTIKEALKGTFLFGDMQTPWNFGRFSCGTQKKGGVAGVTLLLGYDVWRAENCRFGVYGRYTAPTGNKPNPRFIFSPVVGDGKHHELGAGFSYYEQLWQKDDNQSVFIALDGYVVTLLANRQIRSFDFKDKGCLSRYMLLKELTSPTAELQGTFTALGDMHGPGFSYNHALINGINFTTRCAQVKVSLKGEASLRVVYRQEWSCDAFELHAGYNLYGHTREKLCFISPDGTTAYGFKGCTGVAAYTYNTAGATPNQLTAGATTTPSGTPLNSTSSTSSITSCGTVDGATTDGLAALTSTSVTVDWSNALTASPANSVATGTNVHTLAIAHYSNPAQRVTHSMLDLKSGAAPHQITHKGFLELRYLRISNKMQPLVGLCFQAEGSGGVCNLKQWGIFIKTGFMF